MARAAFRSALSKRFSDNAVKIIDVLTVEPAKTNALAKTLAHLYGKKIHALLIAERDNREIGRIARNIPRVKTALAVGASVKDIMTYQTILVEEKAVGQLR